VCCTNATGQAQRKINGDTFARMHFRPWHQMCRKDDSITSDDQVDSLTLWMMKLPGVITTIFYAYPCSSAMAPSDGDMRKNWSE
jgi:hypothetical protein